MVNKKTDSIKSSWQKPSFLLLLTCGYIFLVIERPWESISYCYGLPIERSYAILLIIVAITQNKFIIVKSPTNKWVFGLLFLHFILAPFAYNSGYAIDQGIEYFKAIVLYILMLSIVDDEKAFEFIVKAYIFAMIFYVSHSLWEFHNGRCVYRMGITRMIGVDSTHNSPNGFGASVVLSLPFVFILLRFEAEKWKRRLYYGYILAVVVCVVLTGSRTSFVAMIIFFVIMVLKQKGRRFFLYVILSLVACGVLWNYMPEEKKIRIQTLWDSEAGPANAHESAQGRLVGLEVSWKMFKQRPLTGVGAGGKNFIGYRIENQIDNSPTQSHVLIGEVIAEFGILGLIFFMGMILSIFRCCWVSRSQVVGFETKKDFCMSMGEGISICLLLLLFFGIGGHNFYRPMWLWLAAWAGIVNKLYLKKIYSKSKIDNSYYG